MNFDFLLFKQINSLAGKNLSLDALGIFFSEYFGYLLVLILLLFLSKKFKKYSLMVLQALFAAVLAKEIFVDIIRQIFYKPRPFIENHIYLLVPPLSTPSFPSGHAAFYFAIATIVYFTNKKIGVFFLASAFLISLARVFTGLHWPLDIFVGAIIGIFSGCLVNRATKVLQEQ